MSRAKSQNEIDDMHSNVMSVKDAMDERYKGMTYADGLLAALDWVSGNSEDTDIYDPEELKD